MTSLKFPRYPPLPGYGPGYSICNDEVFFRTHTVITIDAEDKVRFLQETIVEAGTDSKPPKWETKIFEFYLAETVKSAV